MREEWSDDEFLRYVLLHRETDQRLFSRVHANRLLQLAGYLTRDMPAFVGIDWCMGRALVERARAMGIERDS